MMNGCSTMAQWSNIYRHHQHGLETSRSMPLTLDPIHGNFHQEIITPNSQALVGPGISWTQGNATRDQLCSSLPLISPLSGLLANNNVQSQPFDASNNNNGITSTSANSIDQQSLECLFSDVRSGNNNNSKKRSDIQPIQGDQQGHPTYTIHSSSPNFGGKKRQRNNTNNNADNFRPAQIKGSSNISFHQGSSSDSSIEEPDSEAIQQMKEMIYRAAAFRPVNLGVEEMVETPKRKNVRISRDPQTVAARQRRERISEKLRVLQKLVPGGSKMDTASMLDEAANYLKFLRNQVKALEGLSNNKVIDHYNYSPNHTSNLIFPPINLQFSSMPFSMQTISASPFSSQNPCHHVVHVPKS